jgi:hypothetical protein
MMAMTMAMTRQRTRVALQAVIRLWRESSRSVAPLEVFKRIPYSANALRYLSASLTRPKSRGHTVSASGMTPYQITFSPS